MGSKAIIFSFIIIGESFVHGFIGPSKSIGHTYRKRSNALSFAHKSTFIATTKTCLRSSSSSSSNENNNNDHSNSDYYPLQPIKLSKERRERIRIEKQNRQRFLQGDDLIHLRNEVTELQANLRKAVRDLDADKVRGIRGEISSLQQKDAEHVYQEAVKKLEDAELNGAVESIPSLQQEVKDARSSIPHFQLEGMWVGKYGSHGYEMINVTYVGDTLVAYKVTGDQNVPKGEITFKANLAPALGDENALTPIELTESASKQWGVKHLTRFPGKGQVAAEGFKNAHFMEGQLIMVGEYFSFAWIPIGHQIFFGRPSAELVLKLLRESREATADADVQRMRDFANRCLEETISIEEEECILSSSTLGFDDTDLENCFQ